MNECTEIILIGIKAIHITSVCIRVVIFLSESHSYVSQGNFSPLLTFFESILELSTLHVSNCGVQK